MEEEMDYLQSCVQVVADTDRPNWTVHISTLYFGPVSKVEIHVVQS